MIHPRNDLFTQRLLRKIGNYIMQRLSVIAGNHEFALLIFPSGTPGITNYISSGQRHDVIKALREAADRLEKKEDIPATKHRMQ